MLWLAGFNGGCNGWYGSGAIVALAGGCCGCGSIGGSDDGGGGGRGDGSGDGVWVDVGEMVLIAQWMPLGATDGRHSIVGHLLLFWPFFSLASLLFLSIRCSSFVCITHLIVILFKWDLRTFWWTASAGRRWGMWRERGKHYLLAVFIANYRWEIK